MQGTHHNETINRYTGYAIANTLKGASYSSSKLSAGWGDDLRANKTRAKWKRAKAKTLRTHRCGR